MPDHINYPPIIIIGAGIGGVALAVACLHRSIPFTLFERDQSLDARSQGYGLTLQQASKAIEVRRQIAELTPAGHDRAVVFDELAAFCVDVGLTDQAIETYELAIDNDSSWSGPIDALEKILADRQDWSRLESVYRRALSRLDKLKPGDRRRRAVWSVCSRLGILFRAHREDPLVSLPDL